MRITPAPEGHTGRRLVASRSDLVAIGCLAPTTDAAQRWTRTTNLARGRLPDGTHLIATEVPRAELRPEDFKPLLKLVEPGVRALSGGEQHQARVGVLFTWHAMAKELLDGDLSAADVTKVLVALASGVQRVPGLVPAGAAPVIDGVLVVAKLGDKCVAAWEHLGEKQAAQRARVLPAGLVHSQGV